MKTYSKLRLHALFGVSRVTLDKYVDWSSIPGYPKDAKRPKYSPYDVGECLGYTRERVDQIMKEAMENGTEIK